MIISHLHRDIKFLIIFFVCLLRFDIHLNKEINCGCCCHYYYYSKESKYSSGHTNGIHEPIKEKKMISIQRSIVYEHNHDKESKVAPF